MRRQRNIPSRSLWSNIFCLCYMHIWTTVWTRTGERYFWIMRKKGAFTFCMNKILIPLKWYMLLCQALFTVLSFWITSFRGNDRIQLQTKNHLLRSQCSFLQEHFSWGTIKLHIWHKITGWNNSLLNITVMVMYITDATNNLLYLFMPVKVLHWKKIFLQRNFRSHVFHCLKCTG